MAICAVALLLGLLLAPAWAETLEGRVVGVADGGIVTVLDAQRKQHRVRLAGIVAPDKRQPYASRSREYLSRWIYRRNVIVEWRKKDRYGRLVGVVFVDGHDVNLEQVRAGYAWWYRDHSREQTPADREVYELAERAARERKLGLWADPKPVPPREWLGTNRENHSR